MNSKVKNIIINVVLFAVVVFLAIKVYQSINAPIEFDRVRSEREAAIKQRLTDIRDAEIMYKKVYNKYTSNFDTLIDFCVNYEIPVVHTIIDPTDTVDFERTINDTLRYIKVVDSLFGNRTDFDIHEIGKVPYGNNTLFDIHDTIALKGGVMVPLIEVSTPFGVYLKDPGKKFSDDEWKTRVRNLKAELTQIGKDTVLKIGSLEEVTTDGNWEDKR